MELTLRYGFKLLLTIQERQLTECKYQKRHEYRHKDLIEFRKLITRGEEVVPTRDRIFGQRH